MTGKIGLGREPLSCHVRVPGAQNKGSQFKDEILWGWLVVQWYFFPHEILGIGVVPTCAHKCFLPPGQSPERQFPRLHSASYFRSKRKRRLVIVSLNNMWFNYVFFICFLCSLNIIYI